MTAYQVAILGYGSHGRDIETIWNSKHPLWPMKCYDDSDAQGMHKAVEEEDWDSLHWYLGVNDPQQRAEMSSRLPRVAMPLVHNSAVIDERCDFARGVVIGANTTILHEVKLGLHTHVNYNVGMTRTVIGDFCTIAPGVTIAGDVQIGNRVMIGQGADIGNLVTIGDDVVVGMGAVVLPNQTLESGTWVGNPARRIK